MGTALAKVAPASAEGRYRRLALAAAVVVGVVLRWWDLGGREPTFDESFTGRYSHLPLGQLPGQLRAHDAHPPLDYLVRHFFGTSGSTLALRVPSAVFGCLALFVVAWWMWDRGWFGVAVVALTAVSPFQLLYAHQARMYALAILCGTVVVVASERWLVTEGRRWCWVAGGAVLVGVFTHSSLLVLAVGMFVLPGTRRDGAAWRWRATIVGALAVWALIWGPSFLSQFHHASSSWIPFTTVRTAADALNGLTSLYAVLAVVVIVLVALGGWLLVAEHPALGRVWLCLFVVPFLLACVIGLRSHFLLPRTLAFAAWAPPLAFAALVDRAWRTSRSLGWVAVAALIVLIAPSIPEAVHFEEGSAPGLRALAAHVQPGDAVAISPDYLAPIGQWTFGAPATSTPPAALRDLHAFVWVRKGESFSGRVWLFEPAVTTTRTGDLRPCGDATPADGDWVLRCFDAPGVR